jgi:N-methylhydantoinase A/oxoprolinase/acetone carboxylase beta subunit
VIGIDIGRTFTDAFAADETGRVAAARTLSTIQLLPVDRDPDPAEGMCR